MDKKAKWHHVEKPEEVGSDSSWATCPWTKVCKHIPLSRAEVMTAPCLEISPAGCTCALLIPHLTEQETPH